MLFLPHWPKIPILHKNTSLNNLRYFLSLLNNPHKKLPPVIHITGTNGKGSITKMLQNILVHSGYTVHTYTSPHLLYFNERYFISNKMISDEYLHEILEKTRIIYEKHNIPLSFFELITVAGFIGFSEKKADILILETGIGGRLDPTNVIEENIISVINTIDLDHQEILGPTKEHIAIEKAGIIKNNSKLLVGPQDNSIYDILFKIAHNKQNTIFSYEYDYIIKKKNNNNFSYHSQSLNISNIITSLSGDHQLLNASLTVAICENLPYHFKINDIKKGIGTTKHHGRLQKITNFYNYLPQHYKLYADTAHNPAGAYALNEWLKTSPSLKNIHLIIGITKGRDILKFINMFINIKSINCVPVFSEALSYNASDLYDTIIQNINVKTYKYNSIEEAMRNIALRENNIKSTIIVTGSIYLVSDLFKLLKITTC